MLKKETSRYKMNKFFSEMPVEKIFYQPNVTRSDLPTLTSTLNRMCLNTSLTVIIVENHTRKNIL